MKKGDIVIIRDYSYAQTIVGGVLKHYNNSYAYPATQYIVVEVECSFPLENRYCPQPSGCRNNTVLQTIGSDEVVFIHNKFLKPVIHEIIIDGKTIEISDKFYKALKQSLKA